MDFWEAALNAGTVALDTETTGLNPFHDEWLGFSLAFRQGDTVRKAYAISTPTSRNKLRTLLHGIDVVVMHNATFDLNVLYHNGVYVPAVSSVVDSMSAAHMLNENEPVGLKDLARVHLGREDMVELSDLIRKYGSVKDIPANTMYDYASRDAEVTLLLWELFEPRLAEENMTDLFYETEMPNIRVIAEMERRGIAFNVDLATAQGAQVSAKADELLGEIEGIVGDTDFQETKTKVIHVPVFADVQQPRGKMKKTRVGYVDEEHVTVLPFKVNSPAQLCRLLFDYYKLEPVNGVRDATKATLSVLADRHPELRVVSAISEHRKQAKLLSTYYKPLVALATAGGGTIHTHFNPCGTVTGRSSSSSPNMQNCPHTNEFRNLFTAREGYALLVGDLSQAELRFVAHESQDPALLRAYEQGIDLHQQTADGLGTSRTLGKTLNFSLMYGMGEQTLQSRLWTEAKIKITLEEAKDIKARWYDFYSGVTPWQESVKVLARENGFVVNRYGRKRRLPQINSNDYAERGYAEREAVNFMIQSGVAHVVKQAKIAFHDEYTKAKADVHLLLEVHDELVAEARVDIAEYWRGRLEVCMTKASQLCVPIPGEVGIGLDWGSAKR